MKRIPFESFNFSFESKERQLDKTTFKIDDKLAIKRIDAIRRKLETIPNMTIKKNKKNNYKN